MKTLSAPERKVILGQEPVCNNINIINCIKRERFVGIIRFSLQTGAAGF